MFDAKKIYLDNITKKFIENLVIDKPLFEMKPDEARDFLSKIQKKFHFELEGTVENLEVFDYENGSISIKLVRPENCENEILPLILYCHGGGWVLGNFDDYSMTVKTIANCTKSVVAFVEYPHAPEFPYPHALNHIQGALNYLSENADKYNINRNYIAIVGDSAGANMAALTAIKTIKENKVKLCFQALIYPVCDPDMKTESYNEFKNGPWLSKKAMEWFWQSYSPDKEIRKKSSLLDYEDLKGLPPTLIITAENDVLRDEGEEFARKLIEAGVDTVCVRINNTFHDFIMLNALRDSKATKAAYKLLCKFLKHTLG